MSDFKTLEFSQHIFEKSSIINFHKNLSSTNRVVPCGQAYGQTDITNLTEGHLICTSRPEDGRNAAETCSQEPLSFSA